METVKDQIKEAVKEAFVGHNLNIKDFNHDITCFNETGTRCSIVYDIIDPKSFVIIGLLLIPDNKWKVVVFKHYHDIDGIDALNAASFLLSI